jgi:hypothetical protein
MDAEMWIALNRLRIEFNVEYNEHRDTRITQDYWVFWTFPLSGILETRNHDVSETGSLSVVR